MQLYNVNLKVDVPSRPQGAEKTKYRLSKQTEHLEKTKDQNDETAVKHKVTQHFEPSKHLSGGVRG